MKALVLEAQGRLAQKECSVRQPDPDELLVKTEAATICTSDLNDIKHNSFGIHFPMIMGHEGAGVVAAVGKNVTGFNIGDRIAAHPVMPCGTCSNCLRGLPHLCGNMKHLGINREGVFAEYFCIRADRARKIPNTMDYDVASLMEPVSVCIEALERANVKKDGTVRIIGDGPFGIIMTRLLRAYNPGRVILTGRHSFRLAMAGNGDTIHERETADVSEKVYQLTNGEGVDSAVLCVGTGQAVNTAITCLKARGTLSVFSAVTPMPAIDLFRVHVKELNLCGSCNDENYLDRALELLDKQELGLKDMITHRIPFDNWEKAFELAEKGKDEALKVTLTFT